jgi:hypothetical protein
VGALCGAVLRILVGTRLCPRYRDLDWMWHVPSLTRAGVPLQSVLPGCDWKLRMEGLPL